MQQVSEQITRGAARPRTGGAISKPGVSSHPSGDPRWQCLSDIQQARRALKISDREIAVLRGLLSLLPVQDWGKSMIVFASNRVLSQRCDSVEERTLRRRIVRLEQAGLLIRRQSPNGKRYRVKDETGAPALTYGIDLAPLAALRADLSAMAETAVKADLRCRMLKALIRQRLEVETAGSPLPEAERETARLALRRILSVSELEAILASLPEPASKQGLAIDDAEEMSATDRQNVRHIQKSDEEEFESDAGVEVEDAATSAKRAKAKDDLSIGECLTAAKTAAEFAMNPIRSWPDVLRLADGLAPAIGIEPATLLASRRSMGELGSALAVLGLTQALGRVRKPSAYLADLSKRASSADFDCVRMFRSLTGTGRASQLALN